MRQQHFSNTSWEKMVGYCRAVRIGNIIEVAGTTAVDEHGNVIGEGDCYLQTLFILQKAETALQALNAERKHIIRTRIFVTDISQWEKIGKAHRAFFTGNVPVTTMVEISRLIDPKLLVEIEISAIVS